MTNEELEKRMNLIWSQDPRKSHNEMLKQLIKDCIESVTPERITTPTDPRFQTKEQDFYQRGYNMSIQDIKQNTESLLNPPSPQTPHTDA